MDDPEEEDPGESLEEESPAIPPTAGHTDNQEEDNQKNLDQEGAYEIHHRIADQNGQKVYGKPEPIMSDQTNHKDSEHLENSPYDQADLKSSEHTDDKAYDQVENVADGEIDGRVPGLVEEGTSEQTEGSLSRQAKRSVAEQADQAEGRASIQTDRRRSSQTEQRTSEKTYDRLSIPFDPRVSGQTDSRTTDQAEYTTEKIAQRPPGSPDLGTSEEEDRQAERTYEKVDQVDSGTYVKTLYSVDDQATAGADQQTFDQADELKVGEDDYRRHDKTDYLLDKEAYPRDPLSSYGSEYGLLPQFRDGKEVEDRVQPCTFEDSEIHLKTTLSDEVESRDTSPMQSYYPIDTRFTGQFIEKNQNYYQRLPSLSTKSDFIVQEKYRATDIGPSDYSESGQGKSSRLPKQSIYKKRLPPVVYEDPYQVSLEYMEKHNILQIFQITENLVYEKPEDPLNFMLLQVQEMLRKRDNM